MKKLFILSLIWCFCLASTKSFGQLGLYVSSGSNFFIGSGATVSLDSLVFQPTVNFNITGLNREFRNGTVTHALSGTHISRVFHFSSTTSAFSGTIIIYYQDAELSGLSESNLTLHIHNGTSWNNFTSGVTRNSASNFVSTTGISSIPLNELTLADASTGPVTLFTNPESTTLAPTFMVYPNPVKNIANINIGAIQTDEVKLLLYDPKGTLIKSEQAKLSKGSNQLQMDMSTLAQGTYTLIISWSNNNKVIKIIKSE
jgi:hypothetical protein